MTDRLIELETKIAFAEQTVDELNRVVIEQQGRIEKLEKDIERLRRQIARTEMQKTLDSPDDAPDPSA